MNVCVHQWCVFASWPSSDFCEKPDRHGMVTAVEVKEPDRHGMVTAVEVKEPDCHGMVTAVEVKEPDPHGMVTAVEVKLYIVIMFVWMWKS